MTKQEFLELLSGQLADLPKKEREERLAFYSEMIDDRMEDGLTEAEAVALIDAVELPEEKTPHRRMTAGEILLLTLGSPVWLPLLIGALAVVLSLYISLWAVIVSLWAVFGALAGCAVCGVLGGIGLGLSGHVPTGLATLSAGLVCGGLGIFLFYGCFWATKGTALLTKKLVPAVKSNILKRRKRNE